jgi:hypothetical protein
LLSLVIALCFLFFIFVLSIIFASGLIRLPLLIIFLVLVPLLLLVIPIHSYPGTLSRDSERALTSGIVSLLARDGLVKRRLDDIFSA